MSSGTLSGVRGTSLKFGRSWYFVCAELLPKTKCFPTPVYSEKLQPLNKSLIHQKNKNKKNKKTQQACVILLQVLVRVHEALQIPQGDAQQCQLDGHLVGMLFSSQNLIVTMEIKYKRSCLSQKTKAAWNSPSRAY